MLNYKNVVWLINPYDAIPGEKWGYKHAQFLTNELIKRGYKVIYWTSSFSHSMKKQRSNGWEDRVVNQDLTIRIVPTRSYSSHTGFRRILSLLDFARRVLSKGWNCNRPSCIVVSIPNLFGDVFSVWLSRRHKSTLILDFRDLWPEIFSRTLPNWAKRFSRLIFWPFYKMRAYAFRNADGITSVCDTYRQIAFLEAPGLMQRPNDLVYSTGVDLTIFKAMMLDKGQDKYVITKKQGDFWAIYAGTIGNNYDIDTLLRASVLLQYRIPKLRIVVAGDGPLREHLESFISTNQVTNVFYVGVLNMPTLCRYYAHSDLGLSIYVPDSTVAIPAKAFDYFASELPIVNSVRGEFEKIIMEKDIGFQYLSGCPQSLADTLFYAISVPDRLLTMKENLGILAPKYDRKIQYTKFVDLIEKSSRNKLYNL